MAKKPVDVKNIPGARVREIFGDDFTIKKEKQTPGMLVGRKNIVKVPVSQYERIEERVKEMSKKKNKKEKPTRLAYKKILKKSKPATFVVKVGPRVERSEPKNYMRDYVEEDKKRFFFSWYLWRVEKKNE